MSNCWRLYPDSESRFPDPFFPLLQCVQNMVETLFVHLEVLCVHIEPS